MNKDLKTLRQEVWNLQSLLDNPDGKSETWYMSVENQIAALERHTHWLGIERRKKFNSNYFNAFIFYGSGTYRTVIKR